MCSTVNKRTSAQTPSVQGIENDVSEAFQYRLIVDAEPDCVKTIDAEGHLLHMNPAGLRYIEAESLDEVAGVCVYDLVTPEYRPAFVELNQRVFSGETTNLIFEIEGLKGTRRWMETHATPIYDKSLKDKVVAHLAVTHDITQRVGTEKALKESETRFRSVFESGPSGIAIADCNGNVLLVNEALCRLSGYQREELEGKNFRDFLHPDEISSSLKKLRQLFNGEIESYRLVRRYRHKTKSYIWTEANISVIKNIGGQPNLLVNHHQDINDRYQTEMLQNIQRHIFELIVSGTSQQQILNQTCQMFESLFAQDVKAMIFDYDEKQQKLFTNSAPTTTESLIIDLEAVISDENIVTKLLETTNGDSLIIDNAEKTQLPEACQKVFSTYQIGACWIVPFALQNQKLSGVFVLALTNAMQPSKQDLERLQTISYLISISIERVKALAELHESQALLQGAFSNAPMGTALVDDKGIVIQANERSTKIIGFKPEEIVGKSIAEVSHPDDLEVSFSRFKALMAGEIDSYQLEKRYLHKQGGYVWCRLNVSLIKEGEGKSRYAIAHIEDISERMGFEKDLVRTNRALKMLNDCKEVLFHATEEHELFQNICKIAVETGGYCLAWVGYAELDEKKTINPVARAGFEEGYLDANNIYWSRNKDHYCPFTEAINTRQPSVIRNIETEQKKIVWRDEALSRGYHSTVALPLLSGERAIGALVIYSREQDAFDEEEIKLLQNLAENISFGIQSISNRCVREYAEHSLRISEKQFRQLFDENPCMFFIVDENSRVKSVNNFGAAEIGYEKHDIIGKHLFNFSNDEQQPTVENYIKRCILNSGSVQQWEMQIRKRNREVLWVNVMARAIENSEQDFDILVVCEDITEARNLSDQLMHQATHDKLTGLINRHEFEIRLERALISAKKHNVEHVLCYVDLDQFKIINDTCGHVAGDKMLEQLSEVLGCSVRQRDSLARLGGDEFGLLIENCSLEKAEQIMCQIKNAVANFHFYWDDKMFKVGASIGMVSINQDSVSTSDLLMHADNACYTAKDKGRNRVHIHEEGDRELENRRSMMLWTTRIEEAFSNDKFCLAYQSIIPLCSEAYKGEHGEILVRMVDENGGLIEPEQFIAVAERYDLITRIDRYVIKQTFRWLADNQRFLKKVYIISINISGASLVDEGLVDFIIEKLGLYEIPAERICFEITETSAIANFVSALKFVDTLRKHGCKLALDDFGSGLSSFGYLKKLPVDFLKIDGGFVRDIDTEEMDLAIVKSIHDIGRAFNKKTIAEFIENDRILKILQDIGVDYGQGYAIQQPVALDELIEIHS